MKITKLDHLVLTVKNIQDSAHFYESVLGMERVMFDAGRIALRFGNQKINLHEIDSDLSPKAHKPMPGCADLCFITQTPINDAIAYLARHDVKIVEGPVMRTGTNGPIHSIYFRDPDKNLIELANEISVM